MSQMSVYFNEATWHNMPGGCELHTHHYENLKSQDSFIVLFIIGTIIHSFHCCHNPSFFQAEWKFVVFRV
jgi:hypothetical protein